MTATLTATQSDARGSHEEPCGAADVLGTSPRRCGKRRIVGTIIPVERVAQGVDGLALEAKPDVCAEVGSDADMGMAQQLLDDDEVDALFRERGRG